MAIGGTVNQIGRGRAINEKTFLQSTLTLNVYKIRVFLVRKNFKSLVFENKQNILLWAVAM